MWEAEEQGVAGRQAGAEARARAPTGRGEPSSLRRQVAEMQELFARGAALDEVARQYGTTPERVLELFGRHALDREVVAEAVARRRKAERALADEILSLFEVMRDPQAVAKRLALPVERVRAILAANSPRPDPHRRRPGSRRAYAFSKWYSDEELIECLRVASKELGGVPLTVGAYSRATSLRVLADGRPWPTVRIHSKRFGSWPAALRRAGLPLHPLASGWMNRSRR